jgi:hypothetical protein
MAARTGTQVKKTTSKKSITVEKTAKNGNVSKGRSLSCEVCGMAVTVEQIGDVTVEQQSLLLCCGKPMKQKAAGSKTAKKAKKAAGSKEKCIGGEGTPVCITGDQGNI